VTTELHQRLVTLAQWPHTFANAMAALKNGSFLFVAATFKVDMMSRE
jgi:hypothetical protein